MNLLEFIKSIKSIEVKNDGKINNDEKENSIIDFKEEVFKCKEV